MSQPRPLVVIVILTLNQKEVTLQCLQSLDECTYENKRIVLVDNGSTDNVIDSVSSRYPDVICLRNEKNLGAAGGRNVGIDYAVENMPLDYIMFLDNDIVVDPAFLDHLVDELEKYRDDKIKIASPKLYIMGTKNIIDCAGGAMINFYTGSTQTRGHGEQDTGQYDRERFPYSVPTTVLMHRSALERAGFFDIVYDPYGYEDLDMIIRAQGGTGPFLFVPESIVYHKGSKTGFSGYTGDYAKVKARNLRTFLKRHATGWQWICFNLLLPFLGLRTILRELKKGNFEAIAGLIKGFLIRKG